MMSEPLDIGEIDTSGELQLVLDRAVNGGEMVTFTFNGQQGNQVGGTAMSPADFKDAAGILSNIISTHQNLATETINTVHAKILEAQLGGDFTSTLEAIKQTLEEMRPRDRCGPLRIPEQARQEALQAAHAIQNSNGEGGVPAANTKSNACARGN